MANIFAIKSRLKGVESTQKITKSMKLVSTSKLHQTQGQLKRFTPYADNCKKALGLVLFGIRGESPLLIEHSPIQRVCYVVFVGNRGLCGSYNQDLMRELLKLECKETAEYFTVVCGRWGGEVLNDKRLHIRDRFTYFSDVPDVAESEKLAQYLRQLYLSGEADKILLLYQKQSSLSQQPELFQLLPVQAEGKSGNNECIFEPDKKTLIELLCQMYVTSCIRRCLLEARVGEHFARMTAMTSATDNADDLISSLTLKLNRTRQAKITTEITEIAAGAKALGEKAE